MIIDFHAHILPGLDHGCADVKMALQQVRKAKRAGVDCIAATPHFDPHYETVEKFLVRRDKAWNMLREVLTPDLPRVILGAETCVCTNIDAMEGFANLALGDSTAILIEMPFGAWKNHMLDTVDRVNKLCQGCAVLAHVDRYNEESIDSLFELGVRGQINASSLCRWKTRKHLIRWINEGYIIALGSDIHRNEKAYREFGKMKRILGNSFTQIMQSTEYLLFSGAISSRPMQEGARHEVSDDRYMRDINRNVPSDYSH